MLRIPDDKVRINTENYSVLIDSYRWKRLAYTAHQAIGQKRRFTNEPYYNHPFRVAKNVSNFLETNFSENFINRDDVICAAYLHDVVEDTHLTIDDLIVIGVDDFAINLIKDLTNFITP